MRHDHNKHDEALGGPGIIALYGTGQDLFCLKGVLSVGCINFEWDRLKVGTVGVDCLWQWWVVAQVPFAVLCGCPWSD